ncbi:SGNH/GDSL hydrolase family protein [Spiroplasma endosymbiont of Nebria brevicollis]|uniref:SGNH/GDSL hydrolase family protein n=1 Tax=Spiroplasma endosymbiont of Nebria brevicollis TaxID=3066284 RepID=UPI00313B30B6
MKHRELLNIEAQPTMYVIGDSLSDTGALVCGATALFKHLKMPKIVKMLPPFYNNSFSNGPVAIQIVAEHLGITLTSGWKFELFGLGDEQVGNNYAFGGALASKIKDFSVESFIYNNFDSYHQVQALVQQHNFHEKDLIFIAIGGNDILRAIKIKDLIEQEKMIDNAVEALNYNIKLLLEKGAVNIIVANAPDISIVPLFKNNATAKISALELTNRFNSALFTMIDTINEKTKTIVKYDLFTSIHNAMKKFKSLDENHNTIDGAVTTNFNCFIKDGVITPHFNKGVNESNIDEYFFFDDVHPSKWVHNYVAQEIITLIKNK